MVPQVNKFLNYALHTQSSKDPYQMQHRIHISFQIISSCRQRHKMHPEHWLYFHCFHCPPDQLLVKQCALPLVQESLSTMIRHQLGYLGRIYWRGSNVSTKISSSHYLLVLVYTNFDSHVFYWLCLYRNPLCVLRIPFLCVWRWRQLLRPPSHLDACANYEGWPWHRW